MRPALVSRKPGFSRKGSRRPASSGTRSWSGDGTLLRAAPFMLLFGGLATYVAATQDRAPAAGLDQVVGFARVVDGDTLDVRGVRVRLQGVGAPELDQTCVRVGRAESCGRRSGAFLAAMIGGDPVRCELGGHDVYGRHLGVCLRADVDLNRTMVWSGNAVAYVQYSYRYVGDEISARWNRRGVWATDFVRPDAWRRNGG